MLFQTMFDEYFNPPSIRQDPIPNVAQDPVIPLGPSVSIAIDLDAPSESHISSSLDHHSSSVHHGVAGEQYAEVVNPYLLLQITEPFVIVFALDYNSEASSSGNSSYLNPIPIPILPMKHNRKWNLDSHPLDNIIGNPSRPVSTRKQLATDALWCFYNSVLSKVEPKNFTSAVTEDCWFQAMQEEIHEIDRTGRMELVPPPDQHRLVAKGFRQEEGLDFEESFAPVARLEAPLKHLRQLTGLSYLKNHQYGSVSIPKDTAHGTYSIRQTSDHAGCQTLAGSTSACQFLGEKLVAGHQ
ncbi:retrovirus-related pol polyprotein from transposon TNT 1-94 [Tanacetum coccineum]